MLPQGLYSSEFYKLIEGSIKSRGFSSLEDWLKVNPNYWYNEEDWKKIYNLAPVGNPTRTFEQRIGNEFVPIMATYLSDDAEVPVIGNEGFEKQTGDIPRMGQGYFYSSKSYEDARKYEREVGTMNDLVYRALLLDTKNLIQGVHSQRSFTGYQIESKGSYTTTKLNNNGKIANIKIDAHIPSGNTKYCGGFGFGNHNDGAKYTWSSASAKPIGDLSDMFYYAWNNHILPVDFTKAVFRMSRTVYDTLRKHTDTKTRVAMWKTGMLIDNANVQYYTVTMEDLNNYMQSEGLPKIEVVDYYGFTQYLDTTDMTLKRKEQSAFDANTVVLRYAGMFGELQWCKVSNLFSTSMAPVFYTENGAIAIQQDMASKAVRFSAESLCAPVPYAIEKVLRLEINQAAD